MSKTCIYGDRALDVFFDLVEDERTQYNLIGLDERIASAVSSSLQANNHPTHTFVKYGDVRLYPNRTSVSHIMARLTIDDYTLELHLPILAPDYNNALVDLAVAYLNSLEDSLEA